MTRDQLVAKLRAVERALNDRIAVVRVVVGERGKVVRRIYRGTVVRDNQKEK